MNVLCMSNVKNLHVQIRCLRPNPYQKIFLQYQIPPIQIVIYHGTKVDKAFLLCKFIVSFCCKIHIQAFFCTMFVV